MNSKYRAKALFHRKLGRWQLRSRHRILCWEDLRSETGTALNAHPFGPASFPAVLDTSSVKSMWRTMCAGNRRLMANGNNSVRSLLPDGMNDAEEIPNAHICIRHSRPAALFAFPASAFSQGIEFGPGGVRIEPHYQGRSASGSQCRELTESLSPQGGARRRRPRQLPQISSNLQLRLSPVSYNSRRNTKEVYLCACTRLL